MTRDTALFVGFILLFAAVNTYLLVSGTLTADWPGFGVIVAAGFTLALYSFLYKDNPLFKFGEHVYVGVVAAYTFGQVWFPVLYGDLLAPLLDRDADAAAKTNWWLLVPTLLGLLILTRFSTRLGWLSRIAFAFVVGLGAGFAIPRTISSYILAQIEPTLKPLSMSWDGIDLLIILVCVVTVLIDENRIAVSAVFGMRGRRIDRMTFVSSTIAFHFCGSANMASVASCSKNSAAMSHTPSPPLRKIWL